MSMQTFLAGLYPPVDWSKWNPNLNWQPIPIGLNDELLHTQNIDDCKEIQDAWKWVTSAKNPDAKKLLENYKVTLHHQNDDFCNVNFLILGSDRLCF